MEGQLPNSPSAVPTPPVAPPPIAPVAPVVKKGASPVLTAILGLVIVGGIAFAGLTLWQQGLLGGFLAKPTPTPTLAPEPTLTPDPTASWEKYVDAKYGFEFKYPSDWQYKEANYTGYLSSVIFEPKVNGMGELTVYVDKDKYLGTTMNGKRVTCLEAAELWEKEGYLTKDIQVGNLEAKRVSLPGGQNPAQDLVCLESGKAYEFQFIPNTRSATNSIFDQILSTFKFLDKESGGSTTEVVKLVGFEKITGWLEYSSATGYSIQHPSSFQPTAEGEEKRDSACYKYFSNNAGGVLTAKVVPYDGGSRRQLYGVESGYTYQYEEVVIQGQKSLLIEKGPIGDSGSESGVVVPVGNKALILSWSNRAKGSSEFINLLKSIKLGESLDLAKCQTL
jgi:hypothetical protein